jgi:hypothetical protein
MRKLINIICLITGLTALAIAQQDIVVNITRAELTCSAHIDAFGRDVTEASKLEIAFDKSTRSITQDLDVFGNCRVNMDEKCKPYQAAEDWITNKLSSPSNYYIIQVSNGLRTDLTGGLEGTTLQNTLTLNTSGAYDVSESHLLIAKTINAKKQVSFMIKIEPNSSCDLIKNKLPVPPDSQTKEETKITKFTEYFVKPAVKDNPALKFDVSLLGSKRNKSVYSFKVNFRSNQRRRLGFAGFYDLTYFFFDTDVRINAKANDKKNVLNIGGFKINHTRVFHDDGNNAPDINTSRWRFPGLNTTITPRIETEWGFSELSYVADLREGLPINLYQSRGKLIQLNPFIGFEGGFKHLSKESKKGWNIARPLLGAGLAINLFRKDDKPRVAFNVDYIRRFFLRPELSYGYNSAGKEIPDRVSKRPRDQFKARLVFNAKLFSPFIEYEYGRVPPKYTLINSSFKTGIQFDADIPWKGLF